MLGDETNAGGRAALLAAMARPDFYDHRPARVTLHETHISWVFVADDLAYKLKKPVRLPFLDYGSRERRRLMCREEVRLNRRLAPDYYLGVRSVVESAEGRYALSGEADPAAIEHLVEMRAIPSDRTLDRLIAEGRLGRGDIARIAQRLAGFHRDAAVPAAPAESVDALVDALDENRETLRRRSRGAIPSSRLDAADGFTRSFLDGGGRRRLERRAAAGLVRDGHGDLRAEHVLVTDPIQIYDCVEFDRSLREIDVAADLAFLAMDLERLGGREPADELTAAYRDGGGEPGDPSLVAFLSAYRAWVRAKVALLDPDLRAGRLRAAELHALGHRLAWRTRLPFVLWVCGLAASGKSTLAAALAEVSGLPVLDADTTRKRLAGLAATERAAPDLYGAELDRRTYRALGVAAAEEVERHGGVIVDATGRRRAGRDTFRESLGGQTRLLFARCTAPDPILIERARARESDPDRVSDAGVAEVGRQLGSFEPLREVGRRERTTIDTEEGLERQVVAVEAHLDAATLAAP